MRLSHRMIPLLLLAAVGSAWAEQPDRITRAIDSSQTVILKGNVHPKAQAQYDRGPVEASMKLPYITMLMKPTVHQQADLKQFLAEQQDHSSASYHKWLTPEQYADRFGVSLHDIGQITDWLLAQGFTIDQVARGRNWIAFSGTADLVRKAFRTEVHNYQVDGEIHFANATEPSVPSALAGVVIGFRGLNDFRVQPMGFRKFGPAGQLFPIMRPFYTTGGGNTFLGPDDVATIYDITPLYNAGINGAGMKLVVVGQTDINLIDIDNFRAGFGLPKNDPQQQLVPGCTDPGITSDQGEADLDLEWSGAVARNATIIFVKCDLKHGGVFTSAQYAIDNDVAPVVSMSYGGCEFENAGGPIAGFEIELQKANTEGITVLASSGDTGAAACDVPAPSLAMQGLAVNYPASSPEVTGVGGNEFSADVTNPSAYWKSSNSATGESAVSFIPEMAWNDSPQTGTGPNLAPTLAASGGGASSCITTNSGVCSAGFPKPSWQTALTPKDNVRDVPDISMAASPNHDGYILCSAGSCPTGDAAGIAAAVAANSIIGGTSVSTPVFAGIVVLLNQFLKNKPPAGLGNLNPRLYQLAQSTPNTFHDVTTGSNIVPCKPGTPGCPKIAPFQYGYSAGKGYDQATGIGSVDANLFVTGNVAQGFQIAANPTTVTASAPGQSGMTSLTITPVGGFNQTLSYSCSGLPSEAVCTFTPVSATSETLTIQTQAPSAQLRRIGNSRRLFYALLLPGFLGMVVVAGNRKRSLRGVRFLGLIALLAVSTLWMPACGGGSGSGTQSNPGTPTGSYPVSVMAASGSLNQSVPITLVVQ
jgi:subtilase family serine protease